MNEKIKSAGMLVGGFLVIVAMLVLIGLILGGVSWLSDHLLPWFSFASIIAFFLLVLVLLPLSVFRKGRHFALTVIVYLSFLFGATAWMEGLITTEVLWGAWAVVVGLCFMGVGIVPIGMLAALFHAEWAALFEMLALVALALGCRFYAIWLDLRTQREAEAGFHEHYETSTYQQIDELEDDTTEQL